MRVRGNMCTENTFCIEHTRRVAAEARATEAEKEIERLETLADDLHKARIEAYDEMGELEEAKNLEIQALEDANRDLAESLDRLSDLDGRNRELEHTLFSLRGELADLATDMSLLLNVPIDELFFKHRKTVDRLDHIIERLEAMEGDARV